MSGDTEALVERIVKALRYCGLCSSTGIDMVGPDDPANECRRCGGVSSVEYQAADLIERLQALLDAETRKREQVEKDAARYRKMAESAVNGDSLLIEILMERDPDEWDAVLDAAIAQGEQP